MIAVQLSTIELIETTLPPKLAFIKRKRLRKILAKTQSDQQYRSGPRTPARGPQENNGKLSFKNHTLFPLEMEDSTIEYNISTVEHN